MTYDVLTIGRCSYCLTVQERMAGTSEGNSTTEIVRHVGGDAGMVALLTSAIGLSSAVISSAMPEEQPESQFVLGCLQRRAVSYFPYLFPQYLPVSVVCSENTSGRTKCYSTRPSPPTIQVRGDVSALVAKSRAVFIEGYMWPSLHKDLQRGLTLPGQHVIVDNPVAMPPARCIAIFNGSKASPCVMDQVARRSSDRSACTLITFGGQGVWCRSNAKTFLVPATQGSIVDSNGCGAALAAGILGGLLRGQTLKQACVLGTRLATVQLGTLGLADGKLSKITSFRGR